MQWLSKIYLNKLILTADADIIKEGAFAQGLGGPYGFVSGDGGSCNCLRVASDSAPVQQVGFVVTNLVQGHELFL